MNSEAGDPTEGDGQKSDQELCQGSADGHLANIQDCRKESATQPDREEGESCDNGEEYKASNIHIYIYIYNCKGTHAF